MLSFFPPQIIQLFDAIWPILQPIWQFIESWWWLPLPFILWKPFTYMWLWRKNELWSKTQNFILIDIRIPKEVLKPVRAMEIVLAGMRQSIYAPADWWEKWFDGQYDLSYSLEIVSLGGETHFYIRIPEALRDTVESIIYAQYSDAEISIAEDYTKLLPQDIPNEDWDLWGADYRLLKPDAYPIKTYSEFETEREAKEEKRIDPVAALLESMTRVKPGEQLWIQILIKPITQVESSWIKDGMKIKDELAKRTSKPKPKSPMIMEIFDLFVSGKVPGDEPQKDEGPSTPETQLTPGEKQVVSAIENKLSKPGFKTSMRFIFLGKKGVYYKPNLRLPFGFFGSFTTENLNYMVPWGQTLTKIHKSWFLPINRLLERRLYLRKRQLFRNYIGRKPPLFPASAGAGSFVLNTEEVASLYHFPGKESASAPFMDRIETKRGEAPLGLPIEE